MKTSLSPQATRDILARLQAANHRIARTWPGESGERQPVHTVYGGAHLFTAETPGKIGALALKALEEYGGGFAAFARALELPGAHALPTRLEPFQALQRALEADPAAVRRTDEPGWRAWTLYTRVLEKLQREPVEDFRIDFEDGFGYRPDPEEDHHAERAAEELARALDAGLLPPFIGLRIKSLSEELHRRAIRTLDLFLSTLLERTGGRLPPNFVVTLPKITSPAQVTALADLFDLLERELGLEPGILKLELMVETTQAIFNERGEAALPGLIAAARGRCVAAHFGTYDYTAACNITAAHQTMTHPAADFARQMMQVTLAGTGIMLSDGATNVMPIGPHRAAKGQSLIPAQLEENQNVVHRAWRLHAGHVRHSLELGFYQGWDLHPAQLPSRYAALYAFFLEGLEAASARLKNFVEKAAQATLVGDVFDDAATGQGLLNFFIRGINCGAILEQEALATGLSVEELRGKSFVKILEARRKG